MTGSTEFLRFTDPQFPLRRIGLIPSVDSRKRKELETFKAYLLNNNTLGTDTLEIAKLIGSDDMSEAVEIARLAAEKRQAEATLNHQRQQELLQQKAEGDARLAEENWNREEESKNRDRQTAIEREKIKALGRAADKDSDVTGIQEINKAADRALKENDLNLRHEDNVRKYNLEEKKHDDSVNLKMKELELRAKELEEKVKDRESKEYIATINKN